MKIKSKVSTQKKPSRPGLNVFHNGIILIVICFKIKFMVN